MSVAVIWQHPLALSDMAWMTRTKAHRALYSSRYKKKPRMLTPASSSTTTTRQKWPPPNRDSISNICCSHNVCKALAGLGVCPYVNSALYQLQRLRRISKSEDGQRGVIYVNIWQSHIQQTEEARRNSTCILYHLAKIRPSTSQIQASNVSEKSGTGNMSRPGTKPICFTHRPSM